MFCLRREETCFSGLLIRQRRLVQDTTTSGLLGNKEALGPLAPLEAETAPVCEGRPHSSLIQTEQWGGLLVELF